MKAEIQVSMTNRELRECCQPILDAMNALQAGGKSIDQVLMATCFALGLALAKRGVVLLSRMTIRDSLTPIMTGYQAGRREPEKRKETIQ